METPLVNLDTLDPFTGSRAKSNIKNFDIIPNAENIHRICPPFTAEGAKNGHGNQLFATWHIHWIPSDLANWAKPRPVLCGYWHPENPRVKVCPICDKVRDIKKQIATIEAKYGPQYRDADGRIRFDALPDDDKIELQTLYKFVAFGGIGNQGHWYFVSVSPNNMRTGGKNSQNMIPAFTPAILKLGKLAATALMSEIKKYVQPANGGIQAWSLADGLYFNIVPHPPQNSSGRGAWNYTIEAKSQTQKLPDGRIVNEILHGPMPDSLNTYEKYAAVAPDVHNLYPTHSLEQLRAFVDSGFDFGVFDVNSPDENNSDMSLDVSGYNQASGNNSVESDVPDTKIIKTPITVPNMAVPTQLPTNSATPTGIPTTTVYPLQNQAPVVNLATPQAVPTQQPPQSMDQKTADLHARLFGKRA